MPAFRHPPSEDIQRIRQDLRDRYHEGFPILKELLQNADDAGAGRSYGAANKFIIVLCKDCLPGAKHQLLRGSGLCIFNDGSFTAEDANSITSLGLSIKAGQEGAAGKFGLGLKSIFHWAEAFFYFSPNTFTGDPNHQAPGSDLLNPWWNPKDAIGRHREWDEEWQKTRLCDFQAISQLSKSTLNTEQWFGLWIPLRTTGHTLDGSSEVKPIESRFPQPDLNEILSPNWCERLAAMMPLLRRVHNVQVFEHSGTALTSVVMLSVNEGATRMRYGVNEAFRYGKLAGKIASFEVACDVHFAGQELLAQDADLEALKQHHKWPSQEGMGPSSEAIQVPEKGAPHGAVLFTRQVVPGQGSLRVQQAVFLPLGEPEHNPCKGGWSYWLYLHGFFFVDSGRRHIQEYGDLPKDLTPKEANSESEVIRLWNRTLMRKVVAPLVLPSFDAFAKQEGMDASEVEMLVEAMEKSKTLKPLTQWMCRGQRFILRLLPTGISWERQTWNDEPTRWVELPASDYPEVDLFSLLPALADLSSHVAVSLEGKPHLADHQQKPSLLSDEELAKLLGSVPVSAFADPKQLAYLLKLIPVDANERKPDSLLTVALIRLSNQLISHPLPNDKSLANQWKQFFKQIAATAFIGLPTKSTEARPEISRVLADSNLPVALLWQDFRDAEGDGSIDWLTLLPVLRGVGGLALNAEDAINKRSRISVRLLETSTGKPSDWTGQISHLTLFSAREPDTTDRAVSFGDLEAVNADGRLFSGTEQIAKDLAKAAPELKPLLVQLAVAKVLNLQASDCNSAACVRLLHGVVRLAADFSSRKPLFERLLQVARPDDVHFWTALRCLLHGRIDAWQEKAILFDETGAVPVLVQLLRKALDAADQSWRRINPSVAGQLQVNAQQRQHLNLVPTSEAHIESLIQEVGPAKLDCSELQTAECDFILERFADAELLRDLNIHETADGQRVRVNSHTYVYNGTFRDLPAEFDNLVMRIRPRPAYARFMREDGTCRLVDDLNWESVIKISLDQPQSTLWCGTILTAIGMLGSLRTELCNRVRQVAWLPVLPDGAVTPTDLLHLPGAEAALDGLPSKILSGKVPICRLSGSVLHHDRFDTFVHAVLPAAKGALEDLASLLQTHPDWSTGLTGEWSAERVTDWVVALGENPTESLPIAKLVKALNSLDAYQQLLPDFLLRIGGQLGQSAYAEVLNHLIDVHQAGQTEIREKSLRVIARYLAAIVEEGCDFTKAVLGAKGVRLVSKGGVAKEPDNLAFANDSIHPDDQLEPGSSHLLSILSPDQPEFLEPNEILDVPEHTAESLVLALQQYFNPWRSQLTPSDPVGALLALLGKHAQHLSSEFFSTWSSEKVLDWLEEADEATPQLGSLQDRISRREFRVSVVTEPCALVRSIMGNDFQARLADQPTNLLIPIDGYPVLVWQEAGHTVCHLQLRKLALDQGKFTEDELFGLLRETATVVLAQALRANVDVRPLFEKISRATQLQVTVAQNMIVDQALAFLRQIGAQSQPDLRNALARWDDARREEALEESNGQQSLRASELRREARDVIRGLLAGNAVVQNVVLTGVKRKLAEFQYAPTSIPFELWQNADDAAVELGKLSHNSEETINLGFIVSEMEGALLFAHWGRLINEFVGVDGASCRASGFDRDLEKMLVPAISDKTEISAQGTVVLTGKFGLGFKSVFLVTDNPEVVSGNLAFMIRGGIYPVRLAEEGRNVLVKELQQMAPGHWRRGTIIRLPMREFGNPSSDKVLGLFRRLAPLLVAFSRRLKRLRFSSPGHKEIEVHWLPHMVADGIKFGALNLLNGEVRNALILSQSVDGDRAEFLLGLNAHGFVPLPADVPVFWVTAPTRTPPGYGFAVNGPFEPDVGRVQLAMGSEKNCALAKEIARALSSRLKNLFVRASTNWPALRDEMEMAAGVDNYDFWDSLWKVLGRRFADKCPGEDESPAAKLARTIVWDPDAAGMLSFYDECAALPTGLWGDYRKLIRRRDINYVAASTLDREGVFSVVSGWPRFRHRVPVGRICSASEFPAVMKGLDLCLGEFQQVHLANAVEWELGDGSRADPDLAAQIGLLITQEFLKSLREGKLDERDEQEHKVLSELLGNVQFQAADGSWHKSIHLVVAAEEGVVQDEKLRAAFAPQECRLNQAYVGCALEFFLACRPRLEANVETMTTWVLQAQVEKIQVAALGYLLRGELKERLAEELRRQRDDNNWLWKLGEIVWFQARFTADEQHQIRAYILRLFDDDLRQRTFTLPVTLDQPEPEPVHVWTVAELWKWWRDQREPIGDYTLEGEANWELFHGGTLRGQEERKAELKRLLQSPNDPTGKALWYRLFGYACLVSAGRTMTEMRRFWIQRLNKERFWERTSDGDFSQETLEIFERAVTAEFTNITASGEQAYFWRRVFYDIRKVHRMVQNEFPAVLLDLVNQGHGEHLRQFLRTGHLPGPDQRPWIGTFGQSADTPLGFIIRELVRLEVITDKAVLPYAFYVCRPVLRALVKIRWIEDVDSGFSGESWLQKLETDAEYGSNLMPCFDIPLLHMGITHRGDKMPNCPE